MQKENQGVTNFHMHIHVCTAQVQSLLGFQLGFEGLLKNPGSCVLSRCCGVI